MVCARSAILYQIKSPRALPDPAIGSPKTCKGLQQLIDGHARRSGRKGHHGRGWVAATSHIRFALSPFVLFRLPSPQIFVSGCYRIDDPSTRDREPPESGR